MLDKQIQILSVDTGNFYYEDETRLHEENRVVRVERRKLINGYDEFVDVVEYEVKDNTTIEKKKKVKTHHIGTNEIIKEFEKIGISEHEVNQWYKDGCLPENRFDPNTDVDYILYFFQYCNLMNRINECVEIAKRTKEQLLELLSKRVDDKTGLGKMRKLREDTVLDKDGNINKKNVISVFDSSFTRMIGANQDSLCEDFMVVQVYYFDVIKDLIYHGFEYKGEKFIYFTSSAGQIRTKKCVFVKESIWNQFEKTIMCGLTIDDINAKGGNNPNKHLAYMALMNSATDEWLEFDINKVIVIDDFETNVEGDYDFINDETYEITRTHGEVPITHTDGAGMILPNAFGVKQKNKMVRLPWIKGLLGVFDFRKFIDVNCCLPVIKDIYGIEHDVIAEDIQVIFTKSQFKMWKYYDNFDVYKENYKKYHCTAGFTNPEEDRIKDATINYQMLQSLTDVTDEELDKMVAGSVEKLKTVCSSVETVQNFLGASPYQEYKTPFQKCICLYPELINDVYVRDTIKDLKDSLIKRYCAGKIQVHGKYTFLLPDFYAACQYWFQHIQNPNGLLKDGEVFCWLFRKNDKLDCLRSPHLYREHAVRRNAAWVECDKQLELREWYCTNAVYTSSFDLISKILQFDVDGDKSLVVADANFVSVAERNMNGIVPLYYNMKKALPSLLNNQTIYAGLQSAFTGSNIGLYSNDISKIWNSDVFVNGSKEEQQEALDVIKILCCENNFKIDYAKTLYMPERPSEWKDRISKFTNKQLPYFFVYAKDKVSTQVEERNNSFVNRIFYKIPNVRISFKHIDGTINSDIDIKRFRKSIRLQRPNWIMLVSNKNIELDERLIKKYRELAAIYKWLISSLITEINDPNVYTKADVKRHAEYDTLVKHIKDELFVFGYSDDEMSDMLVKYFYCEKINSRDKDLLWSCFGEIIYKNLETNIKQSQKEIQCVDCGEWFIIKIKDSETCRCNSCYVEYRKKYKAQKEKERRERLRGQRK